MPESFKALTCYPINVGAYAITLSINYNNNKKLETLTPGDLRSSVVDLLPN